MNNSHLSAVIGLQWGDEGKGKIVDFLANQYDIIVRFQGGNNAGHTIIFQDQEYKLSLIPSGILRKNKIAVIGNGVVINLEQLNSEIASLRSKGIDINEENLYISELCHIILPYHILLDGLQSSTEIGTTRKGIGPSYLDKVRRSGIRICDFLYLPKFEIIEKLSYIQLYCTKLCDSNVIIPDVNEVYDIILQNLEPIRTMCKPVWKYLNEWKNTRKIIFEGAQGMLLDIDYGTYPYVTSSNTLPGNIFCGTGLGLTNIENIYGITKAYSTRVGNGIFPTEESGEIGNQLGKIGKEFGTVTKRKRRCGWFDIPAVKMAITLSGTNRLIITKLDVLDSLSFIHVGIGYEIDGEKFDYLPPHASENNLRVVYEKLPGWNSNTREAKTLNELPQAAQDYLKYLENALSCKIAILSNGPDRENTIII